MHFLTWSAISHRDSGVAARRDEGHAHSRESAERHRIEQIHCLSSRFHGPNRCLSLSTKTISVLCSPGVRGGGGLAPWGGRPKLGHDGPVKIVFVLPCNDIFEKTHLETVCVLFFKFRVRKLFAGLAIGPQMAVQQCRPQFPTIRYQRTHPEVARPSGVAVPGRRWGVGLAKASGRAVDLLRRAHRTGVRSAALSKHNRHLEPLYHPIFCIKLRVVRIITATSSGHAKGGGYSVNHLDVAPRLAGAIQGLKNSCGQLMGVAAPLAIGLLTPCASWTLESTKFNHVMHDPH